MYCFTRQYNSFELLSLLNSYLGSNVSTGESDRNTELHNQNVMCSHYEGKIWELYDNCPFRTYVLHTPVPEIHVNNLTREKFLQLSNNLSTPLVVRGFLKDTPAVKKWSPQYFAKHYGGSVLPVIANGEVSKMKGYGRTDHKYMKLADICQSILNGEKMYLNNVSRIFGLHPELLNDMQLENVKKYTNIDVKHSDNITNMFMGGKNTGTSLHCAMTGNFFYNIKGCKLWYLIDPKYTPYLLPSSSRTGLFAVSRINIFNAKPGDHIFNIPRYKVVMKSGDLLFNPIWYWHAIKNLSKITIACANRYDSYLTGFKNNPLYSTIFFYIPF